MSAASVRWAFSWSARCRSRGARMIRGTHENGPTASFRTAQSPAIHVMALQARAVATFNHKSLAAVEPGGRPHRGGRPCYIYSRDPGQSQRAGAARPGTSDTVGWTARAARLSWPTQHAPWSLTHARNVGTHSVRLANCDIQHTTLSVATCVPYCVVHAGARQIGACRRQQRGIRQSHRTVTPAWLPADLADFGAGRRHECRMRY